jgi:hypothetical protein
MNVRWLYSHRILVALLVTAVVAVGLMTILVVRQQQDQSNSQVYLEAGGSVGANPFVPLISPPAAASGDSAGGDTSIQTDAGADNRPACDTEKLISYLTKDSQAGAAWVHALNSDGNLSWSGGRKIETPQIPAYVRELTPRVLTEDLRVTDYQFTNGAALAVQSVLEKGTAILVDPQGIARVRCSSGNPLTPMVQQKAPPIYRGKPWPSFQPQRVVATQHAPQCGGDEYYDGARCQRVSRCPDGEYAGDGGRCYGRGNPEPPDNAKRPDMQHWSGQPARLEEPGHPDQPVGPAEPRDPDQPVGPAEPRDPDQPVGPAEPRDPDQPARPEEPRYPEQPVRSEKPTRPTEPRYPDQPARPEKPTRPDKPQRSDESQGLDRPGRPAEAQRPDKVNPHDEPKNNPVQADKQDKSERPGEAQRATPAKPHRPVKPDRPSKPERDVPSDPGDSPE